MNADLLLNYLNANYPDLITSDPAEWAIKALQDVEISAGTYCADWEAEEELADKLGRLLAMVLSKLPNGDPLEPEMIEAMNAWRARRGAE